MVNQNLKVIALIPARLNATRFPAKLLGNLGGKPVIVRTYESTVATKLFDDVIVVTDHQSIEDEIVSIGGKVFRSTKEHQSGSDRIAEAAKTLDADIIVNVQGDEPFVQQKPLKDLLFAFNDESVQVATLVQPLTNAKQQIDPNFVKVVANLKNDALYFSRSLIPYNRDNVIDVPIFEHIGVYAYKKNTLLQMVSWETTMLEKLEKLEQLRLLEHGVPIRLVKCAYMGIEIDTPKDLEMANEKLVKGEITFA